MGLEGWSNPRDLREEWWGSCIRQNVWREVVAASVWERLDLILTTCISSPPTSFSWCEGASYSRRIKGGVLFTEMSTWRETHSQMNPFSYPVNTSYRLLGRWGSDVGGSLVFRLGAGGSTWGPGASWSPWCPTILDFGSKLSNLKIAPRREAGRPGVSPWPRRADFAWNLVALWAKAAPHTSPVRAVSRELGDWSPGGRSQRRHG